MRPGTGKRSLSQNSFQSVATPRRPGDVCMPSRPRQTRHSTLHSHIGDDVFVAAARIMAIVTRKVQITLHGIAPCGSGDAILNSMVRQT